MGTVKHSPLETRIISDSEKRAEIVQKACIQPECMLCAVCDECHDDVHARDALALALTEYADALRLASQELASIGYNLTLLDDNETVNSRILYGTIAKRLSTVDTATTRLNFAPIAPKERTA